MNTRFCSYKLLFIAVSLLVPLLFVEALEIPNPLEYDTFQELVGAIIKFIFNLAIWVAPIMFIIAGFYYITAAGDPEKIKHAKAIILYTAIGLIIVIAARGLIRVFEEIFLKK